jgi:hypothetical protein
LQNKEYISIINNLILRTIIDDLKDQNDPIIVDWKNILFEKETLEQKKIPPTYGKFLQLANYGDLKAN